MLSSGLMSEEEEEEEEGEEEEERRNYSFNNTIQGPRRYAQVLKET